MDENGNDWEKLVKAARSSGGSPEPPSGDIQARLPRLRETVHAITLAWTWRKFSLVALAIVILLLIAIILNSDNPDNGPTLIVPEPANEITQP